MKTTAMKFLLAQRVWNSSIALTEDDLKTLEAGFRWLSEALEDDAPKLAHAYRVELESVRSKIGARKGVPLLTKSSPPETPCP